MPYGLLYTLRTFFARGPLCGMGVASLMDRILNPWLRSDRMAESRPLPMPFAMTEMFTGPVGLIFSEIAATTLEEANGSGLLRAGESQGARRSPSQDVPLQVSNGNDGVVVAGVHVNAALLYMLGLLRARGRRFGDDRLRGLGLLQDLFGRLSCSFLFAHDFRV